MSCSRTLCWDCRRSTDGSCSWSSSYQPVDGWEAEPEKVKIASNQTLQSYNVIACPLFMRNSYEGGQYTPEKYVDHLQKVIKKMERAIKDLKFENAQLHEAMESISKILRAKPAQEAK